MDTVSVLIVEDEAVVALEMQNNLESMGYHVAGRADTGQKAIDLSIKNRPDIVLMDIRLKGKMDGIDAAYEIRKQQDIPIIFLTAYAEEEKLKRAKETLPFGYLLKPVQDRDLKVTIEMALNNARVDAERKKAELDLRISNLFLDSIIDQNPNPIWICDMSGKIIRINNAFLKLFNLREEEILGKHNVFEDAVLESQNCIQQIKSVYEDGVPVHFELDYDTSKLTNLTLSQTIRVYLDVFIYAVRNPEGKITHAVIQFIDISKRKRAEAERLQLAEEFKHTLEGLPNQVFRYRIDRNGAYRAIISEGLVADKLELRTEDIAGKKLEDVVGKEAADTMLPHFNLAFKGEKVSFEMLYSGLWLNTTLIPFETDRKGNVKEIIGFAEDITSEKQTAEAYMESETRFHVLAELAPVGIYLTDSEGKCQYVNRRWCEMAGITFEEALGDGWINGLFEEDRKEVYDKWAQMMATDGIWEHEYRFENLDGEITWVYGLANKITDGNGLISGYIGVNLNINERKQTEQFLIRAQRELEEEVERRTYELKLAKDEAEVANSAKSEFLANISHELRNPMHQILSYSKYGIEKIDNPKTKLKHYFNQIRTSASRLMVLLNDLLDLSKMESGKMEYEKKEHNVESIIDEVVEELSPSFKEKQLAVEKENQYAAKPVICDNFKIAQVIRNLLSNSIKFSPVGKKIVVRLTDITLPSQEQDLPGILISVIDNGVGVPEDERDAIFDKFSQSSKTKSGAGGTGLGLAICREIINAHQGRIWVEHNQPEGAVFNFILPLDQDS